MLTYHFDRLIEMSQNLKTKSRKNKLVIDIFIFYLFLKFVRFAITQREICNKACNFFFVFLCFGLFKSTSGLVVGWFVKLDFVNLFLAPENIVPKKNELFYFGFFQVKINNFSF